MSDIGFPMQFEVAVAKLREARMVHPADGDITLESITLASAQLAMCLAVEDGSDIPEVPSLEVRMVQHWDETNPEHNPRNIVVEEVLTERERAFMPMAETIVGLVYQAARFNTRSLRPRR